MEHEERPPAEGVEQTVEARVRAEVSRQLGGPRGSLETALPIAAFALVFVLTDEVPPAAAAGIGLALALLGVRALQRSSLRFVRNGLFGIAAAAAVALVTGRGEDAFLPGIIQSAVWAAGMAVSIVVRWPLAGFVVGSVLGDPTSWREEPAIVRLSNRLTLVLLLPMLLRAGVQYPLYASGEVGWLGVSRIVLGWPVTALALIAAGAILARGRTPLRQATG